VLLNKKDTLEEGELDSLIEIAHTLNPLAQVCSLPRCVAVQLAAPRRVQALHLSPPVSKGMKLLL